MTEQLRVCTACRVSEPETGNDGEFKNCFFAEYAQGVAGNANLEAYEKLELIAEARVMSRQAGCPFINDVNPSYEGESLL